MAAVGWNGLGGRGVAPDARLKGFNILSSEESPTDFDTNLRASWGDSVQSRDVDVFNNSFGSDLTYYPTISPAAERSLDRLMRRARNGKGGLYVQAAGNTFDSFTVLDDQGNWVERCPVLARTLGVTCSTPATDPLSNQSPLKNPLQAPSVIGDSGTALKDGHPIARIQARKNAIQRSSQRRL